MLSGRPDGLLVGLGVASIALVLWLSARMRVVDQEGHPTNLTLKATSYSVWLVWQVLKANVAMLPVVLSRRTPLPIRPQMVRVRCGADSDLARATLANSITMTPGTVSVAVEGQDILVHALNDATVKDLASGEMVRRAAIAMQTRHPEASTSPPSAGQAPGGNRDV